MPAPKSRIGFTSAGQGDTELSSVSALLIAGGWTTPGPEYNDGPKLVGRRIFADGHGAASVLGFQSATIGPSQHLLRLDNGETIEVRPRIRARCRPTTGRRLPDRALALARR
jgi:hypothetical protein